MLFCHRPILRSSGAGEAGQAGKSSLICKAGSSPDHIPPFGATRRKGRPPVCTVAGKAAGLVYLPGSRTADPGATPADAAQ